ncbi:MAG: DUF4367 domain-containing protein [Lachnospiraceae bacterium]|nr:DUF4367 domain-containing protein [Lachnospiraceae bacterium]
MKQKEFFDLADEMEKECGDWENSEGMSKESYDALISKVERMDREAEAAKEIRTEKKTGTRRFRLRKRYVVVLAAALVLLMGTGVVGDRAWIAESNDLERVSEVTTKVNNEEKDSILLEEEAIYQEIADKLGIAPMRLGYIPNGMELDSYSIIEDTGWAYVNYLYDEKIISIKMVKDNIEVSSNIQWDGQAKKIENIDNIHGYSENIEAYCVDEENKNYAANIKYGNGYYNILGSFSSDEEFLEILNGIYFKNL